MNVYVKHRLSPWARLVVGSLSKKALKRTIRWWRSPEAAAIWGEEEAARHHKALIEERNKG